MRVFISVLLNRIDALGFLQNKATEHLLRINYLPRVAQGQEKTERKKGQVPYLEMPNHRITESQNSASQHATFKIIKLRIIESLIH